MQEAAKVGAWYGEKLPYKRRLAYLESHGTEYIDTRVIVPINATYEYLYDVAATVLPSSIGSSMHISASRDNGINTVAAIIALSSNKWNCYAPVSSSWVEVRPIVSGERVRFRVKRGISQTVCTVNDTDTHTYPSQARWNGFTQFLFGCNYADGGLAASFVGRIYNCTIKVNDVIVFGAIPVLDLDGRPAMYDEVSGQFFYNKGTGEFTWGELDVASALVSSRGGGTKCLTPRRSYRRSLRPSARFSAHSHRWEVAA